MKIKFDLLLLFALCVFWGSLCFSPALSEISWVFALIFWLGWHSDKHNRFISFDKSLLILLLIFLTFCGFSVIWSEYPKQSFRGIFKVLQQIMTCIIAADLFSSNENHRKRFECFFVFWAFIMCFDGFFQYFFSKDLLRGFLLPPSSAGPRVTASFKSYGLFASFLLMTTSYLFMLGLRYRNIEKRMFHWYISFIGSISSVLLLVLTRTRGAYLAMIASLVVALLYRKKFLWIFILASVTIGFISILPKSMIVHFDIQRKDQSIIERYHLWNRAIYVIQAKPFTGTGINTYSSSHMKYDKSGNWRVKNYYAHNGYLQMGAEIGITGLIIFLLFITRFFKLALANARTIEPKSLNTFFGILTGIIGFLFFSAVDTVLHNTTSVFFFWFMLAIAISYFNNPIQQSTACNR